MEENGIDNRRYNMAATGNEAVTLKQLKEMRDDISNVGGRTR